MARDKCPVCEMKSLKYEYDEDGSTVGADCEFCGAMSDMVLRFCENAKFYSDNQEVEVARLRALIDGLHCLTVTGPLGRDCIEVKAGPRPEWKMCQVCRAKAEAAK